MFRKLEGKLVLISQIGRFLLIKVKSKQTLRSRVQPKSWQSQTNSILHSCQTLFPLFPSRICYQPLHRTAESFSSLRAGTSDTPSADLPHTSHRTQPRPLSKMAAHVQQFFIVLAIVCLVVIYERLCHGLLFSLGSKQ